LKSPSVSLGMLPVEKVRGFNFQVLSPRRVERR